MSGLYFDGSSKQWVSVRDYGQPGIFLLTDEPNPLREQLAQATHCPLSCFVVTEDERHGHAPRVAHGGPTGWSMRISAVFALPEGTTAYREESTYDLRLVWAPDHLILAAEAALLKPIQWDWLEDGTWETPEDALQRILLDAIYSHEQAAQRMVDEIKTLRLALKTALDNREMRRIIALNRRMGNLVISLRSMGLTFRTVISEMHDDDPALPTLESTYAEQRRIEEILTLTWERYLGVTNAYTGIIQNNAHTIMKIMTAWLASLMVPIALIMPFHMMSNYMPMLHFQYAWYVLLAYGFGIAGWFFFQWGRKRGFFHK
ncbi:CorA family divalent cation transporter [Acidithiobacillus ferriphilus]|uniref:CorA family divalent cation transporter n=1 Tax=Acidithiobacillus ferriphilus TaxID=1689834 RepID=UPI002DBA9541|nr:CorA family divalent cation transporter [Acidithiobacillus ferriphilus]MEB8535923.1 magnesium transporter CorA [Acidithiobacillus ferriphilus]